MKIEWVVVEKNESLIIPWVIQYWKRLREVVDLKVKCFDNYSTDSSVELLSKEHWIEINYFKTDGLNDEVNQQIKNDAWKGTDADWVVCSDFDEIIFGDLVGVIHDADASGASIIALPWYTLVDDSKPQYDEEKLLHELTDKWVKHESYGKYLIFNPKKIKEINYSPGAHQINPIPSDIKIYNSEKAIILHINKGFGAEFKANAYHQGYKNFSDTNLKNRWGWHYNLPSEKIIEEYREMQKNAVSLKEIYK